MRRFRDIIEDIKAPSIQDLWLDNGKLKYYGENGWSDLKSESKNIPLATKDTDGLMSAEDKNKLDTLILVPSGGTLGQVLKKTAAGVEWGNDENTTYLLATTEESGLMSAADKDKLNGIAKGANNYTLPNASTSTKGGVLMAAAIADLAGTEDTAAICTKINALLSALRDSGALQS